MSKEKINITISFTKDELQGIEEIVNYYNVYNKFNKKDWIPMTVESFIKGSAIDETHAIESYFEISDYKNIGKPFQIKNRFKEVMEEKGLRQIDLSRMTGLKTSSINSIISNKNQPSLDNFFRVWVVLGCPSLHEVLYRESEQ